MKIKKGLVSFILITILALSSVCFVNASEDDPEPIRGMAIIDPVDVTIEISDSIE